MQGSVSFFLQERLRGKTKPIWVLEPLNNKCRKEAHKQKLQRVDLTGWKKLACAPRESSRKQVSRFPVRTLEWSCCGKIKTNQLSMWTEEQLKDLSNDLLSSHLAQILGCRAVVLPAWHAMDKCQHLIFGFYKLWFVRAFETKWEFRQKPEETSESVTPGRVLEIRLLHQNVKSKCVYSIQSNTHCSLSWGLALRLPLITDAGSRRECSHIEFAPLLYNVWTIWSTNDRVLWDVSPRLTVHRPQPPEPTLSISGSNQYNSVEQL